MPTALVRLNLLLRRKIRENLTAEPHLPSIKGKKLQRFDSKPKNNHRPSDARRRPLGSRLSAHGSWVE